MPSKPKRVCSRCQRVVSSRCNHCHNIYRKEYEKGRATSTQRGYGARWRKLRKLVLHRYPVCNHCKRKTSSDVDHITPKALGGEDTMDNLQGLCSDCHIKKTAKENELRGGR